MALGSIIEMTSRGNPAHGPYKAPMALSVRRRGAVGVFLGGSGAGMADSMKPEQTSSYDGVESSLRGGIA